MDTRGIKALQLSNKNKTVMIMNACDIRRIFSASLLPKDYACVSNAAFAIYTILSTSEIFTQPVSYNASKVRESIIQQRSEEQITAMASLWRESISKTGHGPLFGDSTMNHFVFSNWTAAKFFEADLSAALVKEGLPRNKRSNPVGMPSFMVSDGTVTGQSVRNIFPIMGRDAGGNYWMSATIRDGAWPAIEKALASM